MIVVIKKIIIITIISTISDNNVLQIILYGNIYIIYNLYITVVFMG